MLINLGGVENFAIRFNDNDHMVDLVEKWAEQFLRDARDCRSVTICCGRYHEADTREIGRGRLTRRFAARDEFMELLERADVVLSAAGRTTLHEAIYLGKVPILLPEQHYNQYCNIMALAHTRLGRFAIPLSDVMTLGDLPDDDMAATLQIIERTRQIQFDADFFQRFDMLVRTRIEMFRSLEPAEVRGIVEEVAGYLSGADFAATVRGLARLSDLGPRLQQVDAATADD